MIELSNLRIEKDKELNKVICDIKSETFREQSMWFSTPVSFGDIFNAEVYDPFLVAILYPAMYYGEDIYIHGNVSKKLYKNVITYVRKVLLAYSDDLSLINITVDGYGTLLKSANDVGTGFSGGIDSFATFVEHYTNEIDEDYKINRLFFFNVGSHGSFYNPHTQERFKSRYEACKVFPDSLGIPFIPINSNIRSFHEKFGHQKTHPLTLVSGILSVQKILSKYYVSSAIAYSEMTNSIKTARNFDLAEFAEPYLYPLLSPENLDIIPDGEQYVRTEKTQLISDYEPAKKFLNVCIKTEDNYITSKNCSCCPKCLRTLMALDSMGKLNDFSNVFDISIYKKHSFKYKCKQRVLYKKDPFAKDNVDFARKNGKIIPPYLLSAIIVFPFLLKLWVRKFFRLILNEKSYNALRMKSQNISAKDLGLANEN